MLLSGLYLDLLLYVVEDEPLGVDEVVWRVERDGVQRAAVNAASIHLPASRFWPDKPLYRRNKSLRRKRKRNVWFADAESFCVICGLQIFLHLHGREEMKTLQTVTHSGVWITDGCVALRNIGRHQITQHTDDYIMPSQCDGLKLDSSSNRLPNILFF